MTILGDVTRDHKKRTEKQAQVKVTLFQRHGYNGREKGENNERHPLTTEGGRVKEAKEKT